MTLNNFENTLAHIEALGYNPQSDKIHLIAFLPKGHPQTDRKLGKKADQGRKKSFCARMGGVVKNSDNAERAKAAMKRWKC